MGRTKKIVTEYRNYELPQNFPVICLTGERWRISDIRSNNQHFHNCFEIGICHEDSGNMEFFGKPYPFKAGDVTCIPKNIPHTTYSSPGENSLWSYIFFNPSDFMRNILATATFQLDFDKGALANHFLQVNREENPYLYTLVTSIIQEMVEQKNHYQASVRGLLTAFCVELLRYEEQIDTLHGKDLKNVEKMDPGNSSKKPGFNEANESANANVLAPALDFIETNYMQQFTVEDLAILCHLSETHFRRLFHSCIGSSPLDFVTYTRVMAACNLLRSTEDSILEISEAVGFHSISSFNRSFQKIMSQAPREYRNEMIARDKKMAKQSIVEYSGWL